MRVLVASLAVGLTACAVGEGEPSPDPAPDTCGASGYQSFVGTNIAAISLPDDLFARIIGPGDVMTRDYRRERINFFTDGEGLVERVTCG